MLKRRVIKTIILIVIGVAIYLGSGGFCEAGKENYLSTYKNASFSDSNNNGGQGVQYVSYVHYETGDVTMENMFFCNRLGYPPILVNRLTGSATTGSPDISTVTTLDKTDTINPHVAYAMSIGILPANLENANHEVGNHDTWTDLQEIIWDANPDNGDDDGILGVESMWEEDLYTYSPVEVQRFRKVYEEIFSKTVVLEEPLFKLENEQASLFVDQNDGTYIYGPFQLKVNCEGASQDAIDFLRLEIMQKGHIKYIDYDDDNFENSEAYIENFYKFHKSLDENFINNGISDGNKKLLRYDIVDTNEDKKDSYSTIIVDSHGQPIDFPTMSAEKNNDDNFFIKFYPASEGAIINLGNSNSETEMFNLRVKYDSYINYKEHLQTVAFYTKGVIGRLQTKDSTLMVLDPGNTVQNFTELNETALAGGEHNGKDTGVHVIWERIINNDLQNNIINASRPIHWESFLEYIYSPSHLVMYNNATQHIIKNTDYTRDRIDDRDNKSHYYYLNNYYSDLKCLGFSTNTLDTFGSSIFIPFGFAGTSEIETTKNTRAIKTNYAFPLKQSMELVNFHGIVRRKATVKFKAKGSKEVVDVPEHVDEETGETVPATYKNVYKNWTSGEITIYKYAVEDLSPEVISEHVSNIKTKEADKSPGTYIDYPSTPNDGYSYPSTSSWTMDPSSPDWVIDEIYGGNADTVNGRAEGSDGKDYAMDRYGFAYRNVVEGWFYAKEFENYEKRLELYDACDVLHSDIHKYVYKPGSSTNEYDIWIPKDLVTIPTINSQWDYWAYINQRDELKKVGEGLQSFISFEHSETGGAGMEGDVYQYGVKIAVESIALPYLKIAESFGGNVWKESLGVKGILEKDYDGVYDMDKEEAYQGVKVDLYECRINYKEPQKNLFIGDEDVLPGEYLTSTFTDENGNYRFFGKIAENTPLINPLRKYYVKFVYNGQIYAQTLYNTKSGLEYNDPDSDFKMDVGKYIDYTSKGIDEYRKEFNQRFENIYSDSNNYTYTGQRYTGCNGTLTQNYTYTGRAYGLKHVVQEAIDNPNFDSNLDTFEEQYNLFIKNNTHAKFITNTVDYTLKHAGGNQLETPIEEGKYEIVSNDIDKDWEHTVRQPIDYNYNGLSESVKRYLQDCMIEASVPYTPDLDVYGKNIGKTNLHQKFPSEATFNLKDMTRQYVDKYETWKLIVITKKVAKGTATSTRQHPLDPEVIPPRIKKYVDAMNIDPGEGSEITIYTYEGQEYVHIEAVGKKGSQTVKVACLDNNDSIGFENSKTIVASERHENVHPRNDVGTGEPDNPPPSEEYDWEYLLYWDVTAGEEVRVIDHYYEPLHEHYVNIYNKEFDLRHCWSFGVYQRNFNQVELTKDLYKTTLVVNGKKEVYSYSSKLPNDDEDNYNISTKEDQLINLNKAPDGGDSYIGEIRKSDYLYDENISYGNGQYSKNIQAYLTYKIKVKNTSTYSVKINEIADYYDSDNLEFDGIRDQNGNLVVDSNGKYQIATHTQYDENGDVTTSKYTYVTDFSDTMGHDVNTEYLGIYNSSAYTHDSNGNPSYVSETFDIANNGQDNNGQPYHLKTLYIRGTDGNGVPILTKKGGLTNELIPGQSTIIFVTFRVKNNTIDNNITSFANHIKLDQITRNFVDELPTIGKNNFAEINSYASYYTADAPSDVNGIEKEYYRPYGEGKIKYGNGKATYLDFYNNPVGEETDPAICVAGVVDVYSNPGNFDTRDVEVVYTNNNNYKSMQFVKNTRTIVRPYGSMLNRNDPYEESLPVVEPDMDKAPAIRLILDNDQIRKISGYVFEDARTVNSDGSIIGNGEYNKDEGDTPINGVTVQLVELIQDVDYDGTFTGQYIGEKVWDECEYTGDTSTNENKYQLKEGSQNQGVQYYSGKGTKYILNSTSDLTQIYSDPSVANEETEDGKYCFAGLPSGDFIVRFLYGDTDRTVLTNGTINQSDEKVGYIKETSAVNELIGAVNENAGKNAKSYNGQDYKSTVYQRKLNGNSSTNYQVNQDAISYKMKGENEVKGYVDTVNQDYASTYNYNSSELRTKEQLYDSNVIYYTGQPINNTGDLTTAGDARSTNPRDNINNSYGSMWRYDRVATSDKLGLSDANDLYGYRQRGIDYAQGYTTGVSETDKTLLNYRAEVLSSFERVTSQEYTNVKPTDATPDAAVQRAMIDEFINNTYMVAQTGIISMNEEYEGIEDNDTNAGDDNKDNLTTLHRVNATYENHARQVDLGLVERPKAQVKLTKEVSNVEIKLADGQTLFNTNTEVKDLTFTQHKKHDIKYSGNTLENVRVTLDSLSRPEKIQAYIDDEIMNGATLNVTYHLQVENVGEIDYQDRDFYYYGRKSAATTEPVRTKVVRVIDYVANDVSYDASKQNSDAHWDVYEPNDLIQSRIKIDSNKNINIDDEQKPQEAFRDDVAETNDGKIKKIEPRNATGSFYDKVNRDYVSRAYAPEVATYNTIVVTKDMNDNLLPTLYGQGQNEDNTTLILTTSVTASGDSENLTYNNLAEVIETSNSYGRRMAFSISGNQEMANQDINDVGSYQDHHAYSSSKITQPREIDADSAQQIQILPPTGSQDYRNRVLAIITTAIATIIILVGAIIIKKKVYNK